MIKTLTIGQINGYFNILNGASIAKVEDKLPIIKLLRVLKPIATAFREMQEDTQEKCRPENWKEVIAEYQRTHVESEAIRNYTNEVNRCIIDEANKEKELTFDAISENDFVKIDFTQISAGALEELMSVFCDNVSKG